LASGDSSGNVFVREFGTIRDFISDPPDYATIKYSNECRLDRTAMRARKQLLDVAGAHCVDSGGNVFVTGDQELTNIPN